MLYYLELDPSMKEQMKSSFVHPSGSHLLFTSLGSLNRNPVWPMKNCQVKEDRLSVSFL